MEYSDYISEDVMRMVQRFYERDVQFDDSVLSAAGEVTLLSEREIQRISYIIYTSLKYGMIEGMDPEDFTEEELVTLLQTFANHECMMALFNYATFKMMMAGDMMPAKRDGKWIYLPIHNDALDDYDSLPRD